MRRRLRFHTMTRNEWHFRLARNVARTKLRLCLVVEMGEVYRARDLKLKREVAIKILPEEFSRDADRVSRFQREAEVLASLNHPNIAAIYNVEEANATRFLVLELVEGETLAERLRRGPIPVEEALDIAKRVCEALEEAHEKGVIHRDLKPANVKITPDGKVKVLDFGLAKAMEPSPSGRGQGEGFSNSPTLSMAATNAGVILGTAAYMSPEQAKGLQTDARSDVFSFGCVLYEMLTGRQAFQGETISEILASVLVREPDFALLPPDLNHGCTIFCAGVWRRIRSAGGTPPVISGWKWRRLLPIRATNRRWLRRQA